MTFGRNILSLHTGSAICGPSAARVANGTATVQINNIFDKKVIFTIIIIYKQGQMIPRIPSTDEVSAYFQLLSKIRAWT